MRFDTVKILRDSPGITTTLVVSGEDRERVVLRRLDLGRTWLWSRRWLEDEVEAIRRARLSHVIAPTIVHHGPDHIDLVRPFIEGMDVREWFASHPTRSFAEQLRIMATLFHALACLHRLGIAHGGVTPANIVLTENGELVLLDAGVTRVQLAATNDQPTTSSIGADRGDPSRNNGTGGFSADLFGAGLVLLESVAQANHTASVLRRTQPAGGDLTDLSRQFGLMGVPDQLRPVLTKLLDPVVAQRYQTAEEALGELEALMATGGDGTPPKGLLPRSDRAVPAAEPPLVGRHTELAALISCLDGAASGTGSVLCMLGDSGVGKSRLLEAVSEHAAQHSKVTVLRAAAFDQAPARPLGPFSSVFRDLAAHLRTHPSELQRVREELGELIVVVGDQVPELAGAFGGQAPSPEPGGWLFDAPGPAGPAAIARFLVTAFTPHRPGLIVLDDCQWADDLTWQVLEKFTELVVARRQRGLVSVSLIIACRPEVGRRVREGGLAELEFVDLLPLSDGDTRRLIRSINASMSDEAASHVVQLSRGNPLDALLLCQRLTHRSASSNVLAGASSQDALIAADVTTGERAQDGSGPDLMVETRLDLLSAPAMDALRQGAVLGRRFSLLLLASTLQITASEVSHRLQEAVRCGILREASNGAREELEFAHERLRKSVLRTMSDVARQALHLHAAVSMEARRSRSGDYDVAYHYACAGHPAAAVPFALRAGEAGLKRHALDVAESNLAIAEAGLASGDFGDRASDLGFRVHEGLGTVYMLRGNYDLAAKELARAHDLAGAQASTDAVRVATLLSELEFKVGRFAEAMRWRRRSMADLNLRVPGSGWGAWASVGWESVLLAFSWLIRPFRPRRKARGVADAERDRLAARIHYRLAYEWWFSRSPIWVCWAILRSARFSWSLGGRRERAQALATAALLSGAAPILAPLAMRLVNRSLRLRESSGDHWGVAQSHHFRGFVLLASNRYEEAIQAFDTAIAEFDMVGDRWEQVAAIIEKTLCMSRLGALRDAGALARETYWEAKRRGDRFGAGSALALWMIYLPGNVGIDTVMREIKAADPGDRHTVALLQAARAQYLFHTQQLGPALDAAKQADELLMGSGIRNHFLAPIITSHLQMLRLSLPVGSSWWTEERRHQAKTTRKILRRALCSAVLFRAERPAVWREFAMIAYGAGHRQIGHAALRAAARSARRSSAHGELAACAWVASHVGLAIWSGFPSEATITRTVRELGLRVDRGIVEAAPGHDSLVTTASASYQALLNALTSLLAADEVSEVLDNVRDAILATTSARRVELRHTPVQDEEMDLSAGAEMRVTDRLVMPITQDNEGDVAVAAAFPLGEGTKHAPTMEVLVAIAGGVIERERFRHASMERMIAVQEAERGRIARDLHDEFGPLFAAAMSGIGILQRSTDPVERETATEVREILRAGITVARSVAWSLRPSGLDDLGLACSIEHYVEDFQARFPIRVDLTIRGNIPALPPAVATAVFRIVQEALTNVARHSGAREGSVMLVGSADSLRVVVEDNGAGFDVELAGERKSLGLVGVQERARLIGARLFVESSPNQGTTIMVEVPIKL
uniref:histidine kinase n=2 Tax=Rhodococcus TaxID=1827 RepID=O05201_9NOCA|nr:receptor-like histidine kinase BpdS [Rhodococcus sp. M5]